MIAEGCSPRHRPAPLRREEPRGDVMVEPEAVAAMLRLKQLGWGTRRIARELGVSRGTVKRYLAAAAGSRPRSPGARSCWTDWRIGCASGCANIASRRRAGNGALRDAGG